jgi:hypothetical protein
MRPAHGDARVLAMPVTASPLPVPQITVSGGPAPTAAALAMAVSRTVSICLRHRRRRLDRLSLRHAANRARGAGRVPARSGFGTPNPALATLEASDDGEHWRQIASFAAMRSLVAGHRPRRPPASRR